MRRLLLSWLVVLLGFLGRGCLAQRKVKCAPNCRSCVKTGTCEVCLAGYTVKPEDRTCGECAKNCQDCSASGPGSCNVCNIGYTWWKGNVLSSARCEPCAANCRRCDTAGYGLCDVCQDGYELTKDGKKLCKTCSEHCQGCQTAGGGLCDVCEKGYALTTANICGACAANCKQCARAGPGRCDLCNDGFDLAADKTCPTCAKNCQTCIHAGEGRCDICMPGYGRNPAMLAGQYCEKCAEGCKSCTQVQYEGNMVGSNLAAGIKGTWRIHDDSDGGIHAEDRINNDTFYIWMPTLHSDSRTCKNFVIRDDGRSQIVSARDLVDDGLLAQRASPRIFFPSPLFGSSPIADVCVSHGRFPVADGGFRNSGA
ncbi:Proprotein convertase subtilisin/kexin type 5 [Symbiodinium microadriaticum]|uniref:Proprotein convertase subtilisin/kexin type 5 n=1 Tax=Symbiodinium microadriaticum TaxID=2951 RepID=A0A1Q9EAE7_SYMMI|nr:Proprotein convertase subtilisin/kexin type 5 [Symbiodinium microadriaticum]